MKVSDYLRRLYVMDVVIRQKREELEAVREAAASVGASYCSEEKTSGGGSAGEAKFAKLCDKAMDLEREIAEELGYSYRQNSRIYKIALKLFEEKYSEKL